MTTLTHAGSRRMYSWWWDSHISPKNSKWLQENLTDMDSKVKQMIKLIEEDADSFARRAEMYYKKRPELMKLVEEFYRAYRALAERYDHATGVIRHAHRTMAEAFPNQIPMMLTDDLPAVSSKETEPHTPEKSHPSHAFLDPDESQKGASTHFHAIKRNGAYAEEPDSAICKTGSKQLSDLFVPGEHVNLEKHAEGRARRGLSFLEAQEESELINGSYENRVQVLSESECVAKAETDIFNLKKVIAKLEIEKEAGLLQYQQSLERLRNLEFEVSSARDYSQRLDERARKAESEVEALKEALTKLQADREASFLQYQECLEKISNLEKRISFAQKDAGELNERATRAETQAESLKWDLAEVEAEKEAAVVQHKQCLETLSKLEKRLEEAEENARRIDEQAKIAENEIEALKLEVTKLTEEKEDATLRYQQCLEIISSLEHNLSLAEEEVRRLKSEIDDQVEKLNSSEQKCLLLETSNQTLQSDLQSFTQNMASQSEEHSEKQKGLGRLWNCIQEERLRFIEAETAFQTLQDLHSQSQEELRSLAADLHSKVEILGNVESRKQVLEDEVNRVKEENKILNELKLSSSLSIKNLQDEISNLRETIEMFEQEVGLRIDERNALQHEIYCLKEELNDLNRKNQAMMEEVRSTDLDPQCFVSSVKKLQDENSKLKETCKANEDEKAALLVKLEAIEKLLEKNSVLENSLCDLNAELDSVRGKVHELEETCQSLLLEKSTFAAEKATLFSELQTTTEMLEKLSEQNKLLENSLFDVNAELEGLRGKLKILEDTCHSLDHDKSSIFLEKETLVSQLNATHQTLKDLKKQHGELGEKHLELKGERESALKKVEELLVSLYCEREEHSRVVKLNEDELAEKDLQIQILQEDANCRKKDYEEEMNRALHSEIENFILQKCIRDMEKKNFSLLVDCQRLIDSSKMSDRMISILETENIQKQADVNSLSEKIRILRIGLLQVLKTLDTDVEELCGDMLEEDQVLLSCIHRKIQERQKSFDTIFNEKQKMAIENSVLVAFLEQLKQKVENLVTEKGGIEEEFRIQSKQFLALQIEVQKILEKNQGLKSMLSKGEERMEEMSFEIDNLRKQLTDLEKSRNDILEENCQIFEEKNLLMKRFVDLGIEKSDLEEEICAVIHDMMAQSHISLIFQNIILEKLLELKELGEDLAKLRSVNNDLEERLRAMVQKLENSEFDNSHLKESLIKLHVELNLAESINDQLICEIKDEREMLCQKKNKLLKAAEMFQALHAEKTEFQRMVEDLKIKYNEAMGKLEEQTNQNFFFSVDKDRQNEQLRCLCEVNQNLECETRQLHQELREAKLKEQKLSDEVHKGANEIEQWEIQASTLYAELQISAVNETLFEGKVSEVVAAFENLEHRHYSKDMESEQLKERVSDLQVENGKLSNKLAAYVPAVSALNDCITSLEMQTLVQEKPHDFEESKVENLVNQQNTENGRQNGEDQTVITPDALPDFQDMQRRINAVAMAVKELNGRFKPKDEMREIQANKHVTLVDEANGNQHGLTNEQKKGKSRDDIPPVSEIEVLPKDIMLDHISECSSYGISRREALEAKDQMLELWETDDKDGIIDLQIDQAQKTTDAGLGDNHQRGATEEPNNKYSSFESLVEKELSVVDKLEISRRLTQPHEGGNKSKILERLGSDAQKLTNLQITIQDLMKKVEATEKSTKGKGGEYNMVKRQLEAAQDTVTKLFDANRELMKSVEEGTLSSVGKPAVESEDSGSVSRRRIAEHAGRGSEKTGQLQLEVQRLQFLLLKLDDGKERKKKSRMGDRSPRVLLRDYLYGGRTNYQKKKKMPFCACVTPPTKGD